MMPPVNLTAQQFTALATAKAEVLEAYPQRQDAFTFAQYCRDILRCLPIGSGEYVYQFDEMTKENAPANVFINAALRSGFKYAAIAERNRTRERYKVAIGPRRLANGRMALTVSKRVTQDELKDMLNTTFEEPTPSIACPPAAAPVSLPEQVAAISRPVQAYLGDIISPPVDNQYLPYPDRRA